MFDDALSWFFGILAAYVVSQFISELSLRYARYKEKEAVKRTQQQQKLSTTPLTSSMPTPLAPPSEPQKEPQQKTEEEEVAKSPLPRPPPHRTAEEEDALDDFLNKAFEDTTKKLDMLDHAFDNVADKAERKAKTRDLLKLSRYREAMREVEAILELSPSSKDISVLELKCECHLGLRQFKQSLALAKELSCLSPQGPEGPTWLCASFEALYEMGSAMRVWREAASRGLEPFKSDFRRKCEDVCSKIKDALTSGMTSPIVQHTSTKMLSHPQYLADNIGKEEYVIHLNKLWAVVGKQQLVSY